MSRSLCPEIRWPISATSAPGTPQIKNALKENEPKRVALYKLTASLMRAYANIANEMPEAGYTPQEIAHIQQEVKYYENARREVKLASGESHFYQGNRYLLNVMYRKGSPAVIIRNNKTMDIYVRPDSDTAERERVLTTWYRRRLKEEIAP